tara:strand:+ start:874 stop:1284 length:411 start_codon:yes stop_codon:yes gene_type:complete
MAKKYKNIAQAIPVSNLKGMAFALSQGAKDMKSASTIQKKYVEDMGIPYMAFSGNIINKNNTRAVSAVVPNEFKDTKKKKKTGINITTANPQQKKKTDNRLIKPRKVVGLGIQSSGGSTKSKNVSLTMGGLNIPRG